MLRPFSFPAVFTVWQFAPIVTSAVVILAGLYLWGVVRVARRHPARRWPAWRTGMFLGGLAFAIIGTLLWGLALGAQDVIMSAGIARLVPEQSRARAYGVFPAIYGVAWFLGSALLGALYDVSLVALVAASAIAQLLAIVPLVMSHRASQ